MTNPATLLGIDEYLNTSYEPDCDYVDGVLEGRNVGQNNHAAAQTFLAHLLLLLRNKLDIWVVVEQRIRVSAGRVRVPDICVMLGGRPREQVFTTAPFLCVEVLSPDDRMSRMMMKVDDYLEMGVRFVWIVDPEDRKAWIHTAEGAVEVKDGVLRTANPAIEIALAEALP